MTKAEFKASIKRIQRKGQAKLDQVLAGRQELQIKREVRAYWRAMKAKGAAYGGN